MNFTPAATDTANSSNALLGFADAVPIYHSLGWALIHIPYLEKDPPPTGFTGADGAIPSYADMHAWAERHPNNNTAIRLTKTVIGLDVDHYNYIDPRDGEEHEKRGGDTMAEAERRWGDRPPTYYSTSRTDGKSGIRLYRIPEGAKLRQSIEFPELGLGGVEICQHHHRYVMCWPSIHKDPDAQYRWWCELDGSVMDEPPALDDIPELPAKWLEELTVPARNGAEIDPDATFDASDLMTEGEPSQRVARKLAGAMSDLFGPGCRHDTTRNHVLGLLRCGKNGEPGVRQALNALYEAFVNRVYSHRPGGKDEAQQEFKRFVYGSDEDVRLRRIGTHITQLLADTNYDNDGTGGERAHEVGDLDEPDPDATGAAPALADIEEDFWDSPSLKAVYDTALARMCSPWAVLAHCVARGLALVRPNCTLPALIGGPGSLNWFCAIAAESGGGKSSAAVLARELVNELVLQRNPGSGEGLIDAYIKPANKETGESEPPHESVMFVADEVDTVSALTSRSGSTLMSILRSAFSGETLGFSYRTASSRHLGAGSYRLTLAVNVQPARAGALLDDSDSGTAQRFMWFPGTDPRVNPQAMTTSVTPLTVPKLSAWLYPREVRVPTDAATLIRNEHAKRARGERECLNGHALYIREKFAYGLAVIDGRHEEITVDDWRRAGIAMQVSDRTREWVATLSDEAKVSEAIREGRLHGAKRFAADQEHLHQQQKRCSAVAKWIVEKLTAAGSEGMTEAELRRLAKSTNRAAIDPTLKSLMERGAVTKVDRQERDRSGRWAIVDQPF